MNNKFLKSKFLLLIILIFSTLISCGNNKGNKLNFENKKDDRPYVTLEGVKIKTTNDIDNKVTFPITVTKTYDADTITGTTLNNEEVKIRLYGVDAPEKKQEYGINALKTLNSIVKVGDVIYVEKIEKDRYHRIVAKVYTENKIYVNKYLLETGSAWWYNEYAKDDKELEIAFNYAKDNKIGLFANPKAIRPSTYRKNMQGKKNK